MVKGRSRYYVTSRSNSSNTSGHANDPYYFDEYDSGNTTLVVIPEVLTGPKNYFIWSRAFMNVLTRKNKVDFVLGKIPKPRDEFSEWEVCNSLLTLWICNTVVPEIRDIIISKDSVAKIWQYLKDIYWSGNTKLGIFVLRKKLLFMTQGDDTVTMYYTRLRDLWDEFESCVGKPSCTCICTCGAKESIRKRENLDKVVQFLSGLNEDYSAIKRMCLAENVIPNIILVYDRVLQQELYDNSAKRTDSSGYWTGGNQGKKLKNNARGQKKNMNS